MYSAAITTANAPRSGSMRNGKDGVCDFREWIKEPLPIAISMV